MDLILRLENDLKVFFLSLKDLFCLKSLHQNSSLMCHRWFSLSEKVTPSELPPWPWFRLCPYLLSPTTQASA